MAELAQQFSDARHWLVKYDDEPEKKGKKQNSTNKQTRNPAKKREKKLNKKKTEKKRGFKVGFVRICFAGCVQFKMVQPSCESPRGHRMSCASCLWQREHNAGGQTQ